ncbi:MAG: bacillithiol biosynthesis deacetylase BshB1 [Sphingobacteriia bacterium]|nr:MAG: bacillithiol biosynthesis deacetylase BshB1 [Sphingobacteriia bacterium]
MQLDILAFGVHPDDVELGCSGSLLVANAEGKKTGIIDLTRGELGTRGNADTRLKEAKDAAKILGVHHRENLEMADGFLQNDEPHQRKIIEVIRRFRPSIIFANAPEDRHPDHGKSASLVADAAFLAGLRKIETRDIAGNSQEAWRPSYVFHYIQDRFLEPNFIIDISSFMDLKMKSILAYNTQFHNPNLDEPQTYISSPQFLETLRGRDAMLGKRIGVEYGEGFITYKTIGISSLDAIIQKTT